MNSKRISLSIIFLLAFFSGQTAFSQSITTLQGQVNQVKEFSLPPRLYMWGFSGDKTLAEGQGMMPIFGDQGHVLYGLAEINGVKEGSWLLGGGAGYRRIVNNRIYGGYLLADYNTTPNNNSFWILNPGVEMLGTVWDANINGYFPLNKRKSLGMKGWADNLGVYKYVHRAGHHVDDHILKLFEEAGMGGDFEIGRKIPHFEKAKLYLGGYYFDTEDASSVTGASGRLVYEVNKYTAIELEDTYDDENHNKALLGIRFTLGGYTDQEKQHFGISSRLLDPIEPAVRMLPVKRQLVDMGRSSVPEHDNIWYFKPLPSSVQDIGPQQGEGTFEDPFIGFTPTNEKEIDPNISKIKELPLLYFAPGTYSFAGFKGINDVSQRYVLRNGWGMYGRTADYVKPAEGNNRPLFIGGLDIQGGDKTTTLDSIRIVNDKGSFISPLLSSAEIPWANATLYLVNAGKVVIRDTNIQNNVPSSDSNSAVAVYVRNSTVNFVGESMVASNKTGGGDAYGIYAEAQSGEATIVNLLEEQKVISSSAGGDTVTAVGINAESHGGHTVVTADHVDVEVNSIGSSGAGKAEGKGVSVISDEGGTAIVNLENGTKVEVKSETGKEVESYDIFTESKGTDSKTTVTFSNIGESNRVEAESKGGTEKTSSYGIYAEGNEGNSGSPDMTGITKIEFLNENVLSITTNASGGGSGVGNKVGNGPTYTSSGMILGEKVKLSGYSGSVITSENINKYVKFESSTAVSGQLAAQWYNNGTLQSVYWITD